MLARVFVVLLFLTLAPGLIYGSGIDDAKSSHKAQQKASRYVCPMDPDVTSARRGKCPRCGMQLRLAEDQASRGASGNKGATESPYVPSISSSQIPNIRVYDQNGKPLSFYRDLVRGKTVAINFIFTTCTTICPPLTAIFSKVQQDLLERKSDGNAGDIRLISITVDPVTDNPERLLMFAARFKARPGWTFLTGDKTEIDLLLNALGAAVADKNDHTPMILIGNDPSGYWTRSYGLSSPETLLKVILDAAGRK